MGYLRYKPYCHALIIYVSALGRGFVQRGCRLPVTTSLEFKALGLMRQLLEKLPVCPYCSEELSI